MSFPWLPTVFQTQPIRIRHIFILQSAIGFCLFHMSENQIAGILKMTKSSYLRFVSLLFNTNFSDARRDSNHLIPSLSLWLYVKYQGCTLTFFVHSTGAKEVDSFIAQAKKLVALLDISKNNHSAVHHTNRYVAVTMNVAYRAHKIQILLKIVFRQCFFYICT